jgi:hypothetical protein
VHIEGVDIFVKLGMDLWVLSITDLCFSVGGSNINKMHHFQNLRRSFTEGSEDVFGCGRQGPTRSTSKT